MNVQSKCIEIRPVVKLKQVVRKWRKLARVGKAAQALAGKLLFSRTCRVTYVSGDTQVDVAGLAIPPDVPSGHMAVYVGQNCNRRFVIKAAYLNYPVFRALLEKAEEEFGYAQRSRLVIPCDEFLFEHILRLFSRNGLAAVRHLNLEAVKSGFSNEWNCSSEVNGISFGMESRPLLRPFAQKSIG